MKTLLATLVAFTFSLGSAFAAVTAPKDSTINKPSVTKAKSHVKTHKKAAHARASAAVK